MSAFWKVMLGFLLALPVGAYIAGTLVTSQAQLPRDRPPIVISDQPPTPTVEMPGPTGPTTKKPEKTADAEPTKRPERRRPRDDAGSGGDDTGRADDDNEVRVVRPAPAPVDDDDDSDGDDDAEDDSDDGGGDDGGGDD